jgi:hypothetical protein
VNCGLGEEKKATSIKKKEVWILLQIMASIEQQSFIA